MQTDEYQRMYEAEQTHFWFRGTRAVVFDQVRDLAAVPVQVLDLGCGTGGTLTQMPARWSSFGLDSSAQALRFASSRGHPRLVRGSATGLPFASARFDLAFALDVIEHCDDDGSAVTELARVLKPGGRLVATVPAFQILFGPHDVALAHRRRYRRRQFGALLRQGGFSVEKLSYFNSWLFPPSALVRLVRRAVEPKAEPRSDNTRLPGPLNEVLYRIFASERKLLRSMNLPVGLSILAVARTPVSRPP